MGTFKDIYDVGMDAVEARMPLKVEQGIKGQPTCIIVTATNKTRKSAVYVNEVRIHYGQIDYSYCFRLRPYEQQIIQPKETKEFYLSWVLPARVCLMQKVKQLPAPNITLPSFDSPADLFGAIMNGNKNDSWIEIGFNEFRAKYFKKGRIKELFREAHRLGMGTAPADNSHSHWSIPAN
jgi:hypothetical protein